MPHYFSEKQDAPLQLDTISIRLKDSAFDMITANSIFSNKRLDKGTKLLIENAVIENGDEILDLGCGIGVVGIAMKLKYPDTKVDMVDINERAVYVSKKNIAYHKLKKIKAYKSDLYKNVNDQYDAILVNPPQTAGKQICFAMIEGAKHYLKPKGSLQLVARHQKGGKTLEKKMLSVFDNVDVLAKGSGFRVYRSKFVP